MKKLCILFAVFAFFYPIFNYAGEDDFGRKEGSYAIKGSQKIWSMDCFGNRTDFEYNQAGQLINVKRSGIIVIDNAFEGGLLRTQTNAIGATTTMKYNEMGQLIEKITSGGKSIFKYDRYGQMTERTGAGDFPLKFNYNNWGDLVAYTDNNGVVIRLHMCSLVYI